MAATTKKKGSFWNFIDHFEGDKLVWIIVLTLFLFSLVCMFSSTSRLAKGDITRLDIMREQIIMVFIGLGIIILLYNIKNINVYRKLSFFGLPLSLTLLLLLVFRVDSSFIEAASVNESYRILKVGGFQVHVFEVVKVSMVMYLAWGMDAIRNKRLKWGLSDRWLKVILLYVPVLLVVVLEMTGSNSSAIITGAILFFMIILGGGSIKDVALLFIAALVMIGGCYGIYEISNHKAMSRIGTAISRLNKSVDYEQLYLEALDSPGRRTALVDKDGTQLTDNAGLPRTITAQEALDKIHQSYSAKIAIHEGGLFGKGPGQSTQRYVVPAMAEDYMFSFIVEEYGLFGALVVIILYLSLLARGSIIARNCGNDLFAKISVAGLCLLITGQAFLHMFVNAGIGPMTGQTLPLISHGSSAFICFSVAFGIILSFSRIAARRIAKETREAAPLMEMRENVQNTLNDLDAFESGELNDEMENEDNGI